MNTTDRQEVITRIMCEAIERAEEWYCEILAQRYSGMGVTFLGIGADVAVLVKAVTATLQAAKAG
jgi:2-keto-3-deoxy-L-rhamnonate aldolase RhmA